MKNSILARHWFPVWKDIILPPPYRRNFFDNLLKDTLKKNPNLVDAWTAWEPDALDGLDDLYANTENHDETGRYIPYWVQVDSEISCSPLTNLEDFWYVNPFHSAKGILIDPNLYNVGGKDIWVCGVAFPIKRDGKSVGVAGIDMALTDISSMLKGQRIFETGYLSLISDSGLVAVDKNPDSEGKLSSWWSDFSLKSVFDNARVMEKLQHFVSEDKVIHIINPFRISVAEQTWYVVLNVPEKEVRANSVRVRFLISIGFISVMIVLISIVFVSLRLMSNQLGKGVDALKNISQGDGDLTVRLDADKDNEIGKMYTYFNATMEKLQASLTKVKEETENLDSVSFSLVSNMNETAAATNEIASNISSVNKEVKLQQENVNNTGDSISLINENIKILMENIENQSSCVSVSSSAVEEMVANIRSVTDILKSNSKNISALEKSSELGKERIGSAMVATEKIKSQSATLMETSSVIQNIAEQTNLLAMNAAIEAAHAGEAGNGFSVVAEEIRKLAEDSNRQGKKITDDLKEVVSAIKEVSEAAGQMKVQFDEIYNLTQMVSSQELTIMNAMEEQSEGGGQVLSAMKEISSITMDVKSSGNSMENAAKTVNSQMDSLSRITNEITSSVEEMASGISQINKSINNVNDQTQMNAQSIKNLSQITNSFKV